MKSGIISLGCAFDFWCDVPGSASFACMHSFSVAEVVGAAGRFVHTQIIIPDFISCNYKSYQQPFFFSFFGLETMLLSPLTHFNRYCLAINSFVRIFCYLKYVESQTDSCAFFVITNVFHSDGLCRKLFIACTFEAITRYMSTVILTFRQTIGISNSYITNSFCYIEI